MSMIKHYHIPISIQAPYYTLNQLTEHTERVWVIFHGYGQLAQFFIKKFEGLDPKKNFIVAPQGLSKYYLEGFYGRVGASWMTKEDRLTEIENQYSYIQSVLSHAGVIGNENQKLSYFGFSQGTATMGRFAAHVKLPFEKMVIWAGTFPPDTSPEDWSFLSGKEQVQYYTSKEDPFFKEGMIEHQNVVLQKAMKVKPELHWYEGGHKVIPELVKTL